MQKRARMDPSSLPPELWYRIAQGLPALDIKKVATANTWGFFKPIMEEKIKSSSYNPYGRDGTGTWSDFPLYAQRPETWPSFTRTVVDEVKTSAVVRIKQRNDLIAEGHDFLPLTEEESLRKSVESEIGRLFEHVRTMYNYSSSTGNIFHAKRNAFIPISDANMFIEIFFYICKNLASYFPQIPDWKSVIVKECKSRTVVSRLTPAEKEIIKRFGYTLAKWKKIK